MRDYKKWTGKQRQQSLYLTNKAKKLGLIKEPKKCNRCGQTEGILEQHNEDYSFTLDILPRVFSKVLQLTPILKKRIAKCLEDICWRCHIIHHCEHIDPEVATRYWDEIAQEKQYPPVYKKDLSILTKDHGFRKTANK